MATAMVASCAGSPSRTRSSPLPDLTPQLIDAGMYERYVHWRDGYRQWRQGKAIGAKGEVAPTAGQLEENMQHFKCRYPDQAIFKFRQTVSFWIPVLFLEGSLLFAVASLFGASGKHFWPQYADVLIDPPCFAGGLLFIAGGYMTYFEVINTGAERGSRKQYILFTWSELQRKHNVKFESLAGAIAYFVGAVIYQIPCTVALFADEISPTWRPVLFAWPSLIGAICFVLGGVCECAHNHVFSFHFDKLAWWGSALNFLGDVCFLVAVYPQLPSHQVDMAIFVGCVLFAGGSIMSLLMWKSNQFGLTLLPQLHAGVSNRGMRVVTKLQTDGAVALPEDMPEDVMRRSFSLRGVFFVLVYTFTAAMIIVNGCFYTGHHGGNIQSFCIAVQQIFSLVVIHMILVLHSAGFQRLPNMQPFRCLFQIVRLLGLAMMLHSLLVFYVFLGKADDLPQKFHALRARRPLALAVQRLPTAHVRLVFLVLVVMLFWLRARKLRSQKVRSMRGAQVIQCDAAGV
eukprot:TRINITY_DN33007_c0_g1_i1.p1 TRINITY_DN33007_c0_g1~~TRINITY_DN33007_c0_g1_i1.p1  ORF type:complete len:513 (-),score=62.36 TRINITY_DN33007_c0_g1_i1:772-2310(-)